MLHLLPQSAWGLNLTEVSKRTGIPYTTIVTYANSPGMAIVDYTALDKMARVFDIAIEDLVEILEQ
ncbi:MULTISPECIES: helix-turn-helix transcriptional regulator [unclassified Microcoleus]|uniref:helix-turn-helix domain-containing protein n=1 Tax=unclassified Microcoleus TaxID=2642155 RepID=UPI001E0F6B8D|nr:MULTISPECIES: helix-turn-helix transcriptional regulator [unclassified Microcoleus]MCC3469958.1 helix-turn-helix transcriptional regulator [Microcoleus sp. PH2017_06_SFM_O_A]TAE12328.1 MAG: XRE family transcriptional regulator [Oscillatoriales cyanobacterium]MCC3413975.1 helix-turn-helix transcriptional regulator [Microcoleus sp. PH2017_02_FOX_O_A]MCC3435249.1 helix-turn-helix transcriptional regulator [Microcoleus sp. PH2017_05_CCC_O_A]MCC3450144.1 helix-turn-helix transcriptional regulato